VSNIRKVFEAYMSPGSVTEKLYFYVGEYDASTRVNDGGGIADEGEDLEVLEMPLGTALQLVRSGEIVDGKTIMLLQHLALSEIAEAGRA
jgi:nudix-type nucleoside diphosphatase (YffH/AdpP family)